MVLDDGVDGGVCVGVVMVIDEWCSFAQNIFKLSIAEGLITSKKKKKAFFAFYNFVFL